jgi:hypothetical protein
LQLRGMLNETSSSSPFIIAAAFAAAGAFVALQVTTPHTAACFTLSIVSTRSSNPDRRKECKPAKTRGQGGERMNRPSCKGVEQEQRFCLPP